MKNRIKCSCCGWEADERDVYWDDDMPANAYCESCHEDLIYKKESEDRINEIQN
jgi:hypothetical protein